MSHDIDTLAARVLVAEAALAEARAEHAATVTELRANWCREVGDLHVERDALAADLALARHTAATLTVALGEERARTAEVVERAVWWRTEAGRCRGAHRCRVLAPLLAIESHAARGR